MFIREKKNSSGSVSIQIISKAHGSYKVVKTIGCASMLHEIGELKNQARAEILVLEKQLSIFPSEQDRIVFDAFSSLSNSSIRTVGPELIFGRIYDYIGFNAIEEELFRHLVISRLCFPLSKLKTTEYLYRYQGVRVQVSSVYRFLDKLSGKLKGQVEQIAYEHTRRVLGGKISIVFYDLTTLYFEASDEDDLRKTGFNKDGKHQCPQIFIGLLVSTGGYLIGYDIFEGNISEGRTLIPFIRKISDKFNLEIPIVIADSGLLSKENIEALEEDGLEYILGARIKNEPDSTKEAIISREYNDGDFFEVSKGDKRRLIVHYSQKRAIKDKYNRERGLQRLEKRVTSGKLTKSNLNNRGYNKYLKMEGDVTISIDRERYEKDARWDGLKGYLTNTKLSQVETIGNYGELWHVERAFRMSKTDLRIRPIYHRLRERIEAHICIAFTSYVVYKELERVLYAEKSTLSLKKAEEITHNIYQVKYLLPDAKREVTYLLKMDKQQQELYDLVNRNFRVSQ
jgi:transposase